MNHRQEKKAVEVLVGGFSPLHVAQTCAQAAEQGKRLTLTLPTVPGRGSTRRLFKDRDGPRGEVVGTQVDKGKRYDVVAFDPMEVLAWMAHEKLVNVVEKKGSPA